MVEELTKDSIKKKISKDNIKPVVIDFYGSWCAPCRTFAPVFEKISREFKNLSFAKYDVDHDEKLLAAKLQIRSIPSIIVFNKGEEIERIIGTLSEDAFRTRIKEILPRLEG